MKKLGIWLRAVFIWLVKPRLAWITVIVLMVALLLVLRPNATDLQVRIVGLVLQWLGIGTVAWGIRKTRQFFGHPGLIDLFWAWIAQFPRWRVQVRIAAGAANLGGLGGRAYAHSWGIIDPKAPLEDRVRVIATNLENLNNEFRSLHMRTDQEFRKHQQSLNEEERARAAADADLLKRLELSQTGGLHISIAGVVWLLAGVFLTTVPQEILQWFTSRQP